MRLASLALLPALWAAPSLAAGVPTFELAIQNHRFAPESLDVPAGQKIALHIRNLDPSTEEFESYDLNREKIVPGGGEITVYVGPLKAGSYKFFGDFNQATAQGRLIAK